MKKPQISIVAAIGNGRQWNGALGKDGKLLWHIPEDLKRFKRLTLGHPIIMGRKTFESIVAIIGKALPERTNIVVTRDPNLRRLLQGPSLEKNNIPTFVSSVEKGIEKAKRLDQEEIFIGGGGEIYRQALSLADKLYLTLIDDEKEGDSYFPPYEDQFTKKTHDEELEWKDEEGRLIRYRWVDLERS